MADDAPIAPAATVAPVESPAPSAPVITAPVTPNSAPAIGPAAEPATATTPTPVAENTPSSTLLGEKPEAPKEPPAETSTDKPADTAEPPKEEGSQSAEPAPLPAYEAFTFPEGVTVDNERIGEFTTKLGQFEQTTKADHAEVQKLGQELISQHIAEVNNTVERLNKGYADAWAKQKNDWLESFRSDPEIGGKRQETTVQNAREFIRTHGGSETQQAEFSKLMDDTGLGNHPALIRLMANAMNAYREGKPLAATASVKPAATTAKAKAQIMYNS